MERFAITPPAGSDGEGERPGTAAGPLAAGPGDRGRSIGPADGAQADGALKVVSWNINSIRARHDLLAKVVRLAKPDVIVLQETRVDDGAFPLKPWRRRGYRAVALNGRGGHHGVAILSKRPLLEVRVDVIGGSDQPRHVSAVVDAGGPVRLHSLYVPSGGDEPDVLVNAKYAHKLAFLEEMAAWGHGAVAEPALLMGDFNVAPGEHDVWSHRQLLSVISHTPAETEALDRVQREQGWVDVVRRDRPPPEKLYTWWSYRNATWPGSNRGRRLDHVWASPHLAARVTVEILTAARGWPRASDHVPLIASIAPPMADARLADQSA